VDNFHVRRLPPDPPKNEFAPLTSCSIGRGAVAPSQTHPGGNERTATTGKDSGKATKKPKRQPPRGGTMRAGVPNSPDKAPRKAKKRRKHHSGTSVAAKTSKRAYGALRGREGYRPSIPSLRREGLFNPKSKPDGRLTRQNRRRVAK
jgi:hypothetical protein